MKVRCNKMVITRKDMETKEIEVPGFRKILRNTKNPDYKELKMGGYLLTQRTTKESCKRLKKEN